MRFIFGGVHNGKMKWCIENFNLEEREYKILNLIELLDANSNIQVNYNYMDEMLEKTNKLIVKNIHTGLWTEENLVLYKKLIDQLLQWEEENNNRLLILIGDENGCSVVPIEKDLRQLRDNTGFLYKYLVEKANSVYRVWFGIGEKLK